MNIIAAISILEKEGIQMKITLSGIPQYSFKLPDDAKAKFNLFYTADTASNISIELRHKTANFTVSPDLEALATELYFKRIAAEFTVDCSEIITRICVRDSK
ncbi:hypothetical protein H1230_17075 [Paenibacillus sp. 19GGS1-52]|uniref:hypothetical protein n=1 Tax=Paenibacillus sp. 19GGS1-52 TaxID=2758563 RepID=UPI001EFC2BA8|nr:hypothetical protein [Paenibacillus sp. 19GGS1-52]ULO04856.1 hypothetical protein H1230_17075 [Paenibacillus sp. 19GGS1-52]